MHLGPVRSFAVVAAATIALFHLLPEALSEGGWAALGAALLGLALPAGLERLLPAHGAHCHHDRVPTTALALGYSAVLAHQFGEGAVVGSLARTGALQPGLVLALAAHTVPLAMVVAMGILENRSVGGRQPHRDIWLGLGGVATATLVGALLGNTLSEGAFRELGPWLLGVVAGLLLHTLAHDARPRNTRTTKARRLDAAAGSAGLVVALAGLERDGWIFAASPLLRWTAFGGAAVLGLVRSLWLRDLRRQRRLQR